MRLDHTCVYKESIIVNRTQYKVNVDADHHGTVAGRIPCTYASNLQGLKANIETFLQALPEHDPTQNKNSHCANLSIYCGN